MSDEEITQMMLGVFVQVLRENRASRPIPEGPHFVDDDEVLACLDQDLLTKMERQEVREHLFKCSRCQEELAAMMRVGVVTLPPSWAGDDVIKEDEGDGQ